MLPYFSPVVPAMAVIPRIQQFHPELTAWRRDLHAHPQTAFEETYASDLIARELTRMGMTVHRGLAKTGVVGTLQGKAPARGQIRAIGMRADIDALDITEANDLPYKSQYPGKMHAWAPTSPKSTRLARSSIRTSTRPSVPLRPTASRIR